MGGGFYMCLKKMILAYLITMSSFEAFALNQLNWVGISTNKNYTQIVFDCTQKINFKTKYSQDKHMFKISFFDMIGQSQEDKIVEQLNSFKNLQLFDNVEIKNKKHPVIKQSFNFFNTNNPLVIQLKKLEEGNAHRIALNIFSEDSIMACKKASNKNVCIVLDPGHGGNAQGAAFFGQQEKNLNLQLSKQVAALLTKEGYKVHFTRTQDLDLSLPERINFACSQNASLFVSLHVNSAPSPTATGVETYYHAPKAGADEFYFLNTQTSDEVKKIVTSYHKSIAQKAQGLAQSIQSSLIKHIQTQNPDIKNRGVRAANFYVLSQNLLPAALIEVGFLSNQTEAAKLASPKYRNLLAQGICDGIKKFIEK